MKGLWQKNGMAILGPTPIDREKLLFNVGRV